MLKIFIYAITIYVSLSIVFYLFQRQFIYFPDNSYHTPKEAGVGEMMEVDLTTADHLKIKAWYHPPTTENMPTIVYFHGNAGNIANRGFIIEPYLNKGYGVFLMTYRGYSGNPGTPSEKGLYHDARAVMKFLSHQNIPSQCIVLFGNSVGAAVATQMATEFPVGMVIVQSPLSSSADVMKVHYPFFWPLQGLIKDKYDTLSKAPHVNVPVLLIHGTDDTIVPISLGKKLFEAFPGTKEAKYISGKGHNDLFEPDLVMEFINTHLGAGCSTSKK